jgi:hypothetical protein
VSPAPRRGRGRPVTFDDHQRQRYLDAVAAGAKLSEAALHVGITARWASQVAAQDSAFAAALETARAQGRKARAEAKPHDESRYIHGGCRCPTCRDHSTRNRTTRRHTARNTEETTDPERPRVLQLPTRHDPVGDAPPLARVS